MGPRTYIRGNHPIKVVMISQVTLRNQSGSLAENDGSHPLSGPIEELVELSSWN